GDTDPFNEDNTAGFAGVYHPASGPVFAHGTPVGDSLIITAGSNESLSFNGTAYAYPTGAVTAWRIPGHAGNDIVTNSGSQPTQVWGGADNDSLIGGSGNDSLSGDGGNDRLDGGEGNDTMKGGPGDDVYVFGAATANQTDVVGELSGEGT